MENVTASKVTELLDCAAYYTLMKLPVPSNGDAIIHNMIDEEFVREMDNGNFAITNMGELLLAKDLNVFAHLKRKAIRVIKYKGNGKTNAIREQVFTKGYAIQFDDITDYIMTLISQEEIDGARRQEHIMFPRKAIREMLGNMIIHQDLTAHGSGLVMEIFDTKVEASNLGSLLVEVNRIIDTVPHSRNESMDSFLRIVRICEERGSGFDRMEEGMRGLTIQAPKVETGDDFTRTKLLYQE
jgi:predicted HTH transcriptional regulator